MAVSDPQELNVAVETMAGNGVGGRGAIFTQRAVAEFILDLIAYTADQPLHLKRLLEPCFGAGDFLLVAVERLMKAYLREQGEYGMGAGTLENCIRAVELHTESFEKTKLRVREILERYGFSPLEAEAILRAWLIRGDFLLEPLPFSFSHVAGNPPYVRQELVPDELLAEYRRRFRTMVDRGDVYVPFIEKSLAHLEEGGVLGLICSDRWMKNRYGAALREFVSQGFNLKYYVDMVGTLAFRSEVSAYPAITVITRERQGTTHVAHRPEVNEEILARLANDLREPKAGGRNGVQEVAGVVRGREAWVLDHLDKLAILRRLEAFFPTLEETGCKVGIGVATGADKVFIDALDNLDVEPDRKLSLVTAKDIRGGGVQWHGKGVINPFHEDGSLVDLAEYPRLGVYLRSHEQAVRQRNVAKRDPKKWYRTIDRIYPRLASVPKLLIPDISYEPIIVYEEGYLYPHHNLYYITSDVWELRALQAVLLSGIARLFVSTYSTPMRGGYLRYQAQYLRHIRVPYWSNVPEKLRMRLTGAAEEGDMNGCHEEVADLYGLSVSERIAVCER